MSDDPIIGAINAITEAYRLHTKGLHLLIEAVPHMHPRHPQRERVIEICERARRWHEVHGEGAEPDDSSPPAVVQ